ncbi:MAG: hypothetical protein ACRCTA_01090, partial [Bacilli bacterium]
MRNKISIIINLLLAGGIIIALLSDLALFSKTPNFKMFIYYTNLSNILAAIVCLLSAYQLIKNKQIS